MTLGFAASANAAPVLQHRVLPELPHRNRRRNPRAETRIDPPRPLALSCQIQFSRCQFVASGLVYSSYSLHYVVTGLVYSSYSLHYVVSGLLYSSYSLHYAVTIV
jgi:hypothetical protein